MEGDLSLSQSLGGLRIANPDHLSPDSSAEDPPNSVSPLSMFKQPSADESQNTSSPPFLPPVQTDGSTRPQSQLDFNPAEFSIESISVEKLSTPIEKRIASPKLQSSYAQRQSNRASIPPTYQAQQQAQFPQYPTMMPQNQRNPNSTSRPASVMYAPPSGSNSHGTLPSREGSYRVRTDPSRAPGSAVPQRSSSRGAFTAMQAGVPTRDGSYSDRSYRNSQLGSKGVGQLPPRRSSRGMGANQTNNPTSSTPASTSGSPYGLESGLPASSEEWQDRGAAVGVRQEVDSNGNSVSKYVKKGVKDFNFGRTLGEGSYSTVLAATDRESHKEYAIKVLDKRHIIKEKKVKYVNIERDTLNRLTDHPGVVRLYYTFQDERSLYFVLDVASGGELLGVLKRIGTFDEECTRFYGAQILDTIDYMHGRGVIHRDLKPENVLLDDQMHVKITDFGTAKILDVTKRPDGINGTALPGTNGPLDGLEDNRANSFVGTAEYVSPELLTEKSACKASDLWAFGCIIYQLLAGRPPFKAGNEYQTFQKIVNLDYEFPKGFPPVAKDLVERLLVTDPSHRLFIEHIKHHEFFDGISWGRRLWRQPAPTLKSYVPPSSNPAIANGHTIANGNSDSYPADIRPSHSTRAAHLPNGNAGNGAVRPSPRVITELPPPSQLDIEWSPVLTRTNERILKLGNLLVLSMPAPPSPSSKNGAHNHGETDAPSKLSRFFGGSTTKKRPRLVMVTSSARIIMAAAGGEEKKTKTEFSLLTAGCGWRKMQDARGLNYWCIETRERHYTFEDLKSPTSDGSATLASAQEWLDAIERARELALSQSMANSYSGEDSFNLQSPMSSPASTLNMSADRGVDMRSPMNSRHILQKHHSREDVDNLKGLKRFSKRQSKSGLAAVF